MTTHKTWSADEIFQIILKGSRPRANVAEICRRHGISSTTFYKWRKQALASMKSGFRSKEGTPPRDSAPSRERPAEEARRRLRHRQRRAARAPRGVVAGKKRRRALVRAIQARGISSLSRAARMSGISRRAVYTLPRP